MEDLKTEVDILKNKLNTQNMRLITFLAKIDELKQTSIESATLLEEMAFSLLEEEKQPTSSVISHENSKPIIKEEKYIN